MTDGRNVCKHFCLCHCPARLKGSRIGGFAHLGAGRRFGLCACYRCRSFFRMSAVVFAGTGSSTGASVIVPCVNRIVPIMINCANNPGILCNFGITVGVAEVFIAGVASPVFFVSIHCAGWCFIFDLYQIMFYLEESNVTCYFIYTVFHNTTVLSAAHVHCGSRNGIGGVGFACNIRPLTSVIGALLPLIGQIAAGGFHGKGSSFLFFYFHIFRVGRDGGRILHTVAQTICKVFVQRSAVHDHIMISSVQACTVIQRQALALANLQILLQFHIAVHGAARAVPDDAAVFFVACSVLNRSRRSIRNPAVGPHNGIVADGHCGCAGAGNTGAKLKPDISINTGGQTAAVHSQRYIRAIFGLH